MGTEVLLYVPNIIGYIRLLLLFASWFTYYSEVTWSLALVVSSISLDAIDGHLARKLNQTSAFGAWFDVVIDLLTRGMLWCRLYHFGFLVVALEWLTFVCTHLLGANWKVNINDAPWFVEKVMAKNFKTPMGVVAVTGLQVLPIWLYAHYTGILTNFFVPHVLQYIGIAALASARALCMTVELWFIWAHVLYLLNEETRAASK